ncbi:MAG: toprim domain-containing protein [Spirosomataceae bacterium]
MKNTIFINKDLIQKAKEVSIPDLLLSQGFEPIKAYGNELLYYSPIREEKSPSFFVNVSKNCFTDFGDTELKGDSIRLAQVMFGCDFQDAVYKLLQPLQKTPFKPSFSFSGKEYPKITIKDVRRLQNPALLKYITQRCISIDLAQIYLKEVHFESKGRMYFAVGFQNDNDGFELRNPLNFKGKTSNGISTFYFGTPKVCLFEGFFDFLSALQYYYIEKPHYTTIVLNTTNNLKLSYPILSGKSQINSFLDNDKSGKSAVNQLISIGFEVVNYSESVYPNSKDFNDYLIQKSNEKT